jgi:solute carrier family 25 phosphate transporter 23/24/25/41
LLRTRLAASTGTSGSVTAMLADIVRADGAAGLYRGLGATLLQVVPSLALNFSIYESARQWATGSERGGARPGALTSLACGCLAGFTTSTITFPLDVIRRRMQVASAGGGGAAAAATARVSYAGVIRGVMAQQGLSGFYAGIVPEYCKVLPGVAIAFCTYEQMKSWLHAD